MVPLAHGDDGPAPDTRAQAGSRSVRLQFRAGLLGVCLLTVFLGAPGITNEGYVSLHGDMGKYLMNGLFIHDLIKDRPFGSLNEVVDYTRLYYARYPELSLGHHPLLLPAAEAPMFALFGISVTSARLVMLLSSLCAVVYLYLLVNNLYGAPAAFLASAFLATSPIVIFLTRSVMSEMPTVGLMMAAVYYFHRFCATQRPGPLAAFVATAVLSLYAKQLVIWVFPALTIPAVMTLGVKRLFRRDVIIAAIAAAILVVPLVALTLRLSPTNLAMIGEVHRQARIDMGMLVRSAIAEQLTPPTVWLAACGVVLALARRDRRLLIFVVWIASVSGGLFVTGIIEPGRYTVYWIPAFAVLAASCVAAVENLTMRRVVFVVLLAAVGFQARAAAVQKNIVGADGYEEAARFVLDANPGPTVLFSGDVDTGFFTFFIRKHDPTRRLVVLRSDKVLTTSRMFRPSVEDRISRPEEIDGVLHTFGTRYVVIEDRPSRSRVLEWLRQELHSSAFIERKRIPIGTTDSRLAGTSLVVYEFVDATPPASDAVLDMHLPVIGQSVTVKLLDLIDRKYLR
jgi:hypothetical protein